VEEGVASGVGEEDALSLAEAVAELFVEGAGVGEHPLSVARRTSAHRDEKWCAFTISSLSDRRV